MENNIFDQFNGADLDRLSECIKAVRIAGLQIDKYAQAGVNQSSGNVYIWSEDWAGCVYCSIGFDVQWSYSCSNCGEEFDFDTYPECEEFAQDCNDHDQKCTSCRDPEESDDEVAAS